MIIKIYLVSETDRWPPVKEEEERSYYRERSANVGRKIERDKVAANVGQTVDGWEGRVITGPNPSWAPEITTSTHLQGYLVYIYHTDLLWFSCSFKVQLCWEIFIQQPS